MKYLLVFLILCSFQPAWALDGSYVNEITTFASPDSSYAVLENFINDAQLSLYINAYTFSSPYIADEVAKAEARGVSVVLLVEKSPVGGVSEEERAALNRLIRAGAAVYYDANDVRYNHAKYAIADNRSLLITTENFGYDGFPVDNSFGNRGWGAVLADRDIAEPFLSLFFSDLRRVQRANLSNDAVRYESPKGRYEAKFESVNYRGSFFVVPFTAPENAVDTITSFIASANSSVMVEQFYIYPHWGSKSSDSAETAPNLFLEALINAARRGCEVKVILDGSWYNVESDDPASNYYTAKYLEDTAKKENLNIKVKLADLKKLGVEKIHTKGVVVDGRAVLISSVNWNENSPKNNREVGVIIYGEPAEYFADIFMSDWGDKGSSKNYAVIGLIILLIAIIVKKRKN